jgi:hypothetical protein
MCSYICTGEEQRRAGPMRVPNAFLRIYMRTATESSTCTCVPNVFLMCSYVYTGEQQRRARPTPLRSCHAPPAPAVRKKKQKQLNPKPVTLDLQHFKVGMHRKLPLYVKQKKMKKTSGLATAAYAVRTAAVGQRFIWRSLG